MPEGLIIALIGAAAGLATGLGGGGGALIGVPLLGLAGYSLVAASATSLAGVAVMSAAATIVQGWRGTLPVVPALFLGFAAAGLLTVPVGAWLQAWLPPMVSASLFTVVACALGLRLWFAHDDPPLSSTPVDGATGPVCRFAPDGRLRLTARCSVRIALVGIGAGLVAGIAGIGGGVLATPAFMHLAGLGLRAAVANALAASGLIALGGAAWHGWRGHLGEPAVLGWFIGGGLLGLTVGSLAVARLPASFIRRTLGAALLSAGVWAVVAAVRSA